MAIVRDQTSTITIGGGSSLVVAWAVNPVAGAKVLVAIATGGNAPTSVVDNGTTPSAFTLDSTAAATIIYIYRADAITLPSSGAYQVTINFSSSRFFTGMGQSYLGVANGGPAGAGTQQNSGTGTSASVSTGSVTPAVGGSLVFAGFGDNSGGPETITLTGAGFTTVLVNTNASGELGACADQIASSAQTCTWTLSDTPTWNAAILAYPPALANPPAYPRPANRVVTVPFFSGPAGTQNSR